MVEGGGIPLLKSLWEKFDLSLLFLQTGIVKHSGVLRLVDGFCLYLWLDCSKAKDQTRMQISPLIPQF